MQDLSKRLWKPDSQQSNRWDTLLSDKILPDFVIWGSEIFTWGLYFRFYFYWLSHNTHSHSRLPCFFGMCSWGSLKQCHEPHHHNAIAAPFSLSLVHWPIFMTMGQCQGSLSSLCQCTNFHNYLYAANVRQVSFGLLGKMDKLYSLIIRGVQSRF